MQYSPLNTLLTHQELGQDLDVHIVYRKFKEIDDIYERQNFMNLHPNGRSGRRYNQNEFAYAISTTAGGSKKIKNTQTIS